MIRRIGHQTAYTVLEELSKPALRSYRRVLELFHELQAFECFACSALPDCDTCRSRYICSGVDECDRGEQ